MKPVDRELILNVLAGSSAVLAFLGYWLISNGYHGYYWFTPEQVIPLLYLLFSWLGLLTIRLFGHNCVYAMGCLWLWLSLIVGLWTRYGAILIHELGVFGTLFIALGIIFFGLAVYTKATALIWAAFRRIIGILPILVVLVPLIMGYFSGETRVWLGPNTSHRQEKVATVVLLFDELNANFSQGMQNILREKGLNIAFSPVKPVNFSTTEVVPELFTNINFERARPCGLTRVCADAEVLDFDKILVKRNDVDVVGFHHPYCAINGLRFCARLTNDRSIWDIKLWQCAFLRFYGFPSNESYLDCQKHAHRIWIEIREAQVDAVFEAPTIREGGVLFVHLLLPHPPAKYTGSLADQYRRNVKDSERLLGDLLDVISQNKLEPQILIFSDHPLRQASWCDRAWYQFDKPCIVDPALADDYVPLIVAAKSDLPVIEHVQSNGQVFDVFRKLLSGQVRGDVPTRSTGF